MEKSKEKVVVPIIMTNEERRKLRIASAKSNTTVSKFVLEALKEKIK